MSRHGSNDMQLSEIETEVREMIEQIESREERQAILDFFLQLVPNAIERDPIGYINIAMITAIVNDIASDYGLTPFNEESEDERDN